MSETFLRSSFKKKLFDFVLARDFVFQPTDDLSASVLFGDWRLDYSPLSTLSRELTSEGKVFYFLGDVFELNKVSPKDSIGHYVGIEFDSNEKTICIFRSRNSFLGLYYHAFKDGPVFWGNFSRAKDFLDPLVDPQKIDSFFEEGLISDGNTLFKGIRQVAFQKRVSVKKGVVLEESEPVLLADSPVNRSAAQFLDFTMDRFQQWFKHCSYNSVAVSGGADSRLLCATLQKFPAHRDVTLHSRCHPKLLPEQDADVLIAKRIAAILQKGHDVQRSQQFPSAYLSQEFPAVPPIMSGLYGGELLGGELLQLVSNVRIKKDQENAFAHAVEASAQMFLCDFYGGAWSVCSAHHNLTLTPFWDSYFIAAMLQTPTSVIKGYSLLSKMYEHLPANLKELPFVSIFTDYQPQWKKPLPGVNPKSINGDLVNICWPDSWRKYKEQLPEDHYRARAGTLWFYLKAFYDLSDEDLLSLL